MSQARSMKHTEALFCLNKDKRNLPFTQHQGGVFSYLTLILSWLAELITATSLTHNWEESAARLGRYDSEMKCGKLKINAPSYENGPMRRFNETFKSNLF